MRRYSLEQKQVNKPLIFNNTITAENLFKQCKEIFAKQQQDPLREYRRYLFDILENAVTIMNTKEEYQEPKQEEKLLGAYIHAVTIRGQRDKTDQIQKYILNNKIDCNQIRAIHLNLLTTYARVFCVIININDINNQKLEFVTVFPFSIAINSLSKRMFFKKLYYKKSINKHSYWEIEQDTKPNITQPKDSNQNNQLGNEIYVFINKKTQVLYDFLHFIGIKTQTTNTDKKMTGDRMKEIIPLVERIQGESEQEWKKKLQKWQKEWNNLFELYLALYKTKNEIRNLLIRKNNSNISNKEYQQISKKLKAFNNNKLNIQQTIFSKYPILKTIQQERMKSREWKFRSNIIRKFIVCAKSLYQQQVKKLHLYI